MSLPWHRLPFTVSLTIFEMARMVPTPSCEAFRNAYTNVCEVEAHGDAHLGFKARLLRHFYIEGSRIEYFVVVRWFIPPPRYWERCERTANRAIDGYRRDVETGGGLTRTVSETLGSGFHYTPRERAKSDYELLCSVTRRPFLSRDL